MRLKALAAASLLLPLVALPAAASSLPHADFGTTPILGLGLGGNQTYQPGGSFSLDVPLGESVMVGGAVASTLYGGLNFDVRGVYRFVLGEQGSGPSIAAMLGVWGQPGLAGFQTGLGRRALPGLWPVLPDQRSLHRAPGPGLRALLRLL